MSVDTCPHESEHFLMVECSCGYEIPRPASSPMADVVITIRARVPQFALDDMFAAARRCTPADGILSVEVDGSAE